jgi:hypothetical protein
MKKDNLVILRSDKALEFETDTMYPNRYYRCLKVIENDREEYIVYGIKFDKAGFENAFEFAYDRIMRDWERIGLIKNGKLVSKKGFKELANVHLFGKQTNNLRIIFFGLPKECMYGFYPKYRENQAKQLITIYQWCENVIEGNMEYFDFEYIQFGNQGFPIYYRNLRSV